MAKTTKRLSLILSAYSADWINRGYNIQDYLMCYKIYHARKRTDPVGVAEISDYFGMFKSELDDLDCNKYGRRFTTMISDVEDLFDSIEVFYKRATEEFRNAYPTKVQGYMLKQVKMEDLQAKYRESLGADFVDNHYRVMKILEEYEIGVGILKFLDSWQDYLKEDNIVNNQEDADTDGYE